MDEILEAIYRAALEQVVLLLNHEDPYVRLEVSMRILGQAQDQTQVTYEDMSEAYAFQAAEAADRDDMAELDEFGPGNGEVDEEALAAAQALAGSPTAMVPATDENMAEIERRLAAAQVGADVPVEPMPAGYRPGNSGIGSGERKGTRRGAKKRHGRR